MDSKQSWYTKWVVAENRGDVLCPACSSPFPIDPTFDNAPRWCPSCKQELVHWNFYSVVLTLNPEAAPPLVKHMIDFISRLPDFEAEEAMIEVYHLFDRKFA